MPNEDLEASLSELPDLCAAALEKWRICTLNRQKYDALLAARLRGEDPERNSTQIKEMIAADEGHYNLCLEEIKAESNHLRLYEGLMSVKRRANLRVAF